MTPTQPTPEEQVEAQKIAEDFIKWWSGNVHFAAAADPRTIKLAHAYRALLTQQSQERVELRAEVDRQLGRHLCYTGEHARRRFWKAVDQALAASPGKGAEGEP